LIIIAPAITPPIINKVAMMID